MPALSQATQITTYLEQQISEGVGARVGFVYYGVRNQQGTFQPNRPASAYSVPFQVCDKGLNGVGCAGGVPSDADDAMVTFYGVPNSAISGCVSGQTTPTANCLFPNNQVVKNSPDNGTYKTIEFSLNKRQSHNYSLGLGGGYTWQHDFPYGYPNTPNAPADYDFTSYSFKANGTYNAPWGILLSALYRFQAGQNYARRLSVSAPSSCNCTFSAAAGANGSNTNGSLTATNVFVTPYNQFRLDRISVFDLRVEKTVNLGGTTKVRLFLDGFNLFNQYAAETITTLTGPQFQQPTAILGPRTGRIGFRFMW